MTMTFIKGAADGGTAFEPLKHGDRVLDEDDNELVFDRYGITGWFGFFTYAHGSGVEHKLPLAGMRLIEGKRA